MPSSVTSPFVRAWRSDQPTNQYKFCSSFPILATLLTHPRTHTPTHSATHRYTSAIITPIHTHQPSYVPPLRVSDERVTGGG